MCNILNTILSRNFEEPLETFQQLVDNNITLFNEPRGKIWKQTLEQSSFPEYNKLAETFKTHSDWREYDHDIDVHLLTDGTHALLKSFSDGYLRSSSKMRGWYTRSKEKLRGHNPFGGYLSNKKWHLNEVNICILIICEEF